MATRPKLKINKTLRRKINIFAAFAPRLVDHFGIKSTMEPKELKDNYKETRTTSMTPFWCLYFQF